MRVGAFRPAFSKDSRSQGIVDPSTTDEMSSVRHHMDVAAKRRQVWVPAIRQGVRHGSPGLHAGMSYRGVSMFLWALDCPSGKSSIERDVAQVGVKARALHRAAGRRLRVKVLGVDGTGAAMAGRDEGLLFLVDVGNQRLIGVEMMDESRRMRFAISCGM